jgi:hypothetical protein
VPESPIMRRIKRAAAAKRRIDAELDRLVVEAVEARENQTDIARIIGRSREHVRLVARRAAEQQRDDADDQDDATPRDGQR